MKSPINNTAGRARGFTLVELLLAITLMSILLALTYGGLRAATRSSVQGEKLLAAEGGLRATHQFLRRQFNQMLPLSFTTTDDADKRRVVFVGSASSIQYVAPMPGYLGVGGPQVQLLEIVNDNNGDMMLQFSHALLQGFEEDYLLDRDPITLLEGIDAADFEYLGKDEEGELTGWTANWDQLEVLPVAVRVNVAFREDSKLNWPELVTGVKVDESATQASGVRGMSGRNEYQQAVKDMIKGKNRGKAMMRSGPIKSQRGIALVLVLWVLLLLTIVTASFSLMARMNRLEANTLLSGTQARLAAEAAINLAVLALRDPDDETRMRADGRVYQQDFDGILVEVSAIDERGKLDINATDELTLANIFIGNGMEMEAAELLAAAVMDWRDTDELERVNGAEEDAYLAAGLEMGPANRPFMMSEELLQVIGMSYQLYRKLEPGITVYSNAPNPEPAFAPVEALMAMPDITYDEAVNFVAERNSQQPGDSLGTELPNGIVVMEQGRGVTYSIQARATMPNGVWEQLQATIRLGGTRRGSPYRILRWREGFQ